MTELNEDIDNLFREVVEPAEMQPSKTVWTSIDKKLDEKQYFLLQQKYRRILNFSIGISVVVISLLYLIFNQNSKKENYIEEPSNTINQTASSSDATNNKMENAVSEITNSKKNNTSVNNIQSGNNSTSNAVTPSNNNRVNQSAVNSSVVASSNNNNTNHSSTINPVETITNTNKPVAVSNSNNDNQQNAKAVLANNDGVNTSIENNKENAKKESENKSTNASIDNSINDNAVITATDNTLVKPAVEENNLGAVVGNVTENNNSTSSALTGVDNKAKPIVQDTAKNESSTKQDEVLNSSSALANAPKETATAPQTVDTAKIKSASTDTTITNTTDFNNPPNTDNLWKAYKFFVGAFYSPDKVNTTPLYINGNGNSFIEQNKFSYSAGIKAGYEFKKHWTVTAAIDYSTISSAFTLSKTIFSDEELKTYSFFTTYGDVIGVPVTTTSINHVRPGLDADTTKIQFNGTEKTKYISVPIECRFTLGKKLWSGYASVGIAANFLSSQKVVVNDAITGNQYSLNTIGLQKTYFNTTISIGVKYRIAQHLSLFVEPTYRRSLTAITKDLPYTVKPSYYGISLGLNFLF